MVKKKIAAIWQAGIEDFAARREKIQAARAAGAGEPNRRSRALERESDERTRRAVLEAVAPLRQEIEALREEVAQLRKKAK